MSWCTQNQRELSEDNIRYLQIALFNVTARYSHVPITQTAILNATSFLNFCIVILFLSKNFDILHKRNLYSANKNIYWLKSWIISIQMGYNGDIIWMQSF